MSSPISAQAEPSSAPVAKKAKQAKTSFQTLMGKNFVLLHLHSLLDTKTYVHLYLTKEWRKLPSNDESQRNESVRLREDFSTLMGSARGYLLQEIKIIFMSNWFFNQYFILIYTFFYVPLF